MCSAAKGIVRDWFIITDYDGNNRALYESDEKLTALTHASNINGVLHHAQSIEIDDFREKPEPPSCDERRFLCGTKRVAAFGSIPVYRVLCATCGAGGSVSHSSWDQACVAAVRDSGRACNICGAA